MRFSLMPKEGRFFGMLHQSTTNIQSTARKLVELMEDYNDVPAKVAEIDALEEVGDQIIRDINAALHKAFITPLDREDIQSLTERLDDVVDDIEEAARTMLEYRVEAPTPHAVALSRIILQCADELEKAVGILHLKGKRLAEVLPHCVELNRLENEADQVTSRGVAELFSDGANTITILKWRDIYSFLEQATDRAEDAANVLEGIVLKHS